MAASRMHIANDPTMVTSIMTLAKHTRAFVGIRLHEIGLAVGQDELLIALEETDGATVCALADAISVRPSTVSKMLDRLVAKKLVRRDTNGDDRRHTIVFLSAEGAKTVAKIHAVYAEIDQEFRRADETFGDPRRIEMVQLLNKAVHQRLMRLR